MSALKDYAFSEKPLTASMFREAPSPYNPRPLRRIPHRHQARPERVAGRRQGDQLDGMEVSRLSRSLGVAGAEARRLFFADDFALDACGSA